MKKLCSILLLTMTSTVFASTAMYQSENGCILKEWQLDNGDTQYQITQGDQVAMFGINSDVSAGMMSYCDPKAVEVDTYDTAILIECPEHQNGGNETSGKVLFAKDMSGNPARITSDGWLKKGNAWVKNLIIDCLNFTKM